MSTYESAYKSLLQGVSQQLPPERLPGQLTAQVNMLSDPVTNLRRRPGVAFRKGWDWTDADSGHILAWFTDIAGARINILLNTVTGNLRILDEDYVQEASLDAGAYLQSTDPSRIRATAVGNEFFFCNVDKAPELVFTGGPANPALSGFFYITSGAFGRTYNVSVVHSGGQTDASYTTPSGTGGGDAALSTPEYIATELAADLSGAGWTVYRDGPYVYIVHATVSISVNTNVGKQYLISSNGGFVTAEGDLPARLPSQANGYICRVGSGASSKYFKYVHATTEWVEAGAYGSATGISNMPISLYWTGAAWALDTSNFDGRTAGDDTSNPSHEFMLEGITGMGTYQGRLVLMSGPLVSLSASGKPRKFYRTTVTSVIASDPIEIGSGRNTSAAYEWCVPFYKDLLLFSRAYQALIPSGNTAITPATATVLPTSAHEQDTLCSPITLGRTLMYPNPRSEDFFGVLEMVPSNSTDSQYVSQDSTPHLPKYMGGRCRFAVSSGVASMALFGPTGDTHSIIVHEYHWDGDEKVQQAWHQWTFPYEVATAYFASDMIVLVFVENEQVVLGTLDPRAGALDGDGNRRPFLDLTLNVTITDHVIPIPAWMLSFDPDIGDKLAAIVSSGDLAGDLAGDLIGTAPNEAGDELITVLSHPSGTAGIGIPYYSGFIPSPPVVTDYQQNIIHSGKATLLRFHVGTQNSSEFNVIVTDGYSTGEELDIATLSWSSPELELGRGLFSEDSTSIVPCRTDLRTTAMEVWTVGTGELNVTSLEYVAKFHPKIKRK